MDEAGQRRIADLQGRYTTKEAAHRAGRLPGICVDTKYVIPREWYERMLRGDWCPQQDKEVAA